MIEKFITLAEAAEQLGVSYVKVQRAAKLGAFPTYSFQNRRILVRLSEVVAYIESTGLVRFADARRRVNADDPVEYLSPPDTVVDAAGGGQ